MTKEIDEKLFYLKELIEKADKRIKKYYEVKKEEDKETYFFAISKFVEEIIETSIKINNIL
jgi:hypothetical protein